MECRYSVDDLHGAVNGLTRLMEQVIDLQKELIDFIKGDSSSSSVEAKSPARRKRRRKHRIIFHD